MNAFIHSESVDHKIIYWLMNSDDMVIAGPFEHIEDCCRAKRDWQRNEYLNKTANF